MKDERKQSKLFRTFQNSKKKEDHQHYNTFRKKLSKKKKRRKKAYFRELIKEANAKKDFKKTWQAINKALKRGGKSLVRPEHLLLSDGTKSKSEKIIANILNKHFTSIGEKLADKLTETNSDPISLMGDKNSKSIFLDEIKLHEVLEEISNIDPKKAMGCDEIPPKIIKWALHILAQFWRNYSTNACA